MKLVYRGAEADVLLGSWGGETAIFKFRKRLPYRLRALDSSIRAHRTVHEAQMIHEARKAGVRTPYIYYVGPAEALIVMEYIAGERLKQRLANRADAEVMLGFGKAVGLMHTAGIMHGDLTTSNVILDGDSLAIVDFGLSVFSNRLEDHAVDLRLIKETLVGAHSSISGLALKRFLKGYGKVVGVERLESAKRKLAEIERRGRYARVE